MLLSSTADVAKSNYVKNRGNPGQWFEHKADYVSPRPNPRARPAGRNIAEKNRPTVESVLHQQPDPKQVTEEVMVRLRSEEAQHIAHKFNFQEDRWFDFEANYQYRPPPHPVKCYPKTYQELAETNNQQKHNEWYDHSNPAAPQPYHTGRGITKAGRNIADNIRASRADEWFQHKPYQDQGEQRRSSSACPPRTKREGQEYAVRGRGSANDWSQHHTIADDASSNGFTQPYRCTSAQAVQNWDNARGQNMSNCFDYTTGYVSDRPAPRVRGTAEEYLGRNQKGTLGTIMQGKGPGSEPMMARGVRPNGAEYQEKNRGQMNDYFDQTKNRDYSSPRPVPRAKTKEAQHAMERNKGKMNTVLGENEYPNPAHIKKIQVRGVRSEMANQNAQNCKGSSMKELVENYRLPADQQPKARITGNCANEVAMRNHGSINTVLTNYGRQRPMTPPVARNRPEAAGNAEKHRGTGLFDVIAQKPPSVRY